MSLSQSNKPALEAIDSILKTLDGMKTTIKLEHQATESAVLERADDVKNEAVSEKQLGKVALSKDNAWVKCVEEEKGLRLKFDQATKTYNEKLSQQLSKCQFEVVTRGDIPSQNVDCTFDHTAETCTA